MSAQLDLLEALRSYVGFGQFWNGPDPLRIVMDEVDQKKLPPYVVINRDGGTTFRGLDGGQHGGVHRFAIQCVAIDRDQAVLMGDVVRAALELAGQPHDDDESGYDPELGTEVEVVRVDWWVD